MTHNPHCVYRLIRSSKEMMRMKGKRYRMFLSIVIEMKDLHSVKHFLGIEVSRSNKWTFLWFITKKYVLELLHENVILACQPPGKPMEENHKLHVEQNCSWQTKYERLVWRLMYLSHMRPDFPYALTVLVGFFMIPLNNIWKLLVSLWGI